MMAADDDDGSGEFSALSPHYSQHRTQALLFLVDRSQEEVEAQLLGTGLKVVEEEEVAWFSDFNASLRLMNSGCFVIS